MFINFARQQTDETDFQEKSPCLRRTGPRQRVRRRAERLRAIWSDDVRFSALEEEDGNEDEDDDWQVTFSDRVSCSFSVERLRPLTPPPPPTPRSAKWQTLRCNMARNTWQHTKVLLKMFRLNSNTKGFVHSLGR